MPTPEQAPDDDRDTAQPASDSDSKLLADNRPGRLDHLAPGIPVAAKAAVLLGVAGGLFLAIVLSYANPDRQYAGLALGVVLGILGALVLTVRNKRKSRIAG